MRKHDIVFYGASFFLTGIVLASFSIKTSLIIIFTLLLTTVFLLLNLKQKKGVWLSGLSIFILIGSFYYALDNQRLKEANVPFEESASFSGVVLSEPEVRETSQRFVVKLNEPYSGKILVYTDKFESIKYGDLLEVKGVIKAPNGFQKNYLAKDRISGVLIFAEVKRLEENQASSFRGRLYEVKSRSLDIFKRSLEPQKSAFMGGITLGERADFSDAFKESMSLSGTTHLVALSGYNITIIASAVAIIFGYFLRRRLSFILTILVIVGFVLMTGAEASIVRAAIMGMIGLLAHQSMRVYSFRNAVAIAAFVMVLFNPKILVFDIGFQLSFLALLGIVYLKPAIEKFFKLPQTKSLLNWRDNALMTVSAQLAVIPVLLSSFGQFSLSAFPANILILEAIPHTMLLGFIMVLLGFIAFPLAVLVGWLANIFLSYELFLIRFFAKLDFLLIKTTDASLIFTVLYFSLITGFIIYVNRSAPTNYFE